MYVGWKRTETDQQEKPPGVFLSHDEIFTLREVWEKFGKPRIPAESSAPLWPIIANIREARSEAHRLEDANLRIAAETLKAQGEHSDVDGEDAGNKGT
jgi:hypothetical protein